MGSVSIHDVTKSYRGKRGIVDLSLDVDDGEFFVMLGPSGAGKTTTLKSVAGLVEIDAGSVEIAGRGMDGVQPYHRNVAMAFESYALYPQRTVSQNLASPLRSGRTGRYSENDQRTRIEAVTTTLGISHLLQRFPRELSNGQRQRVALGRVLVRPADVYLLDEPLSHLDAKLRAAMRAELKQLGSISGTTVLYVTHDYQEALALGDRIAVLREGRLVQVGPPQEVWQHPVDTFVAKALGQPEVNLLDADLVDGVLVAAGGAVRVPLPPGVSLGAGPGPLRARVGLRPRDLEVDRRPADASRDGLLLVDGVVDLAERLGRSVELSVRVGGEGGGEPTELIVVDDAEDPPTEGDRVRLSLPLANVHVFAARTGDDPEEDTPNLRPHPGPAARVRDSARTTATTAGGAR